MKAWIIRLIDGYAIGLLVGVMMGMPVGMIGFIWCAQEPIKVEIVKGKHESIRSNM